MSVHKVHSLDGTTIAFETTGRGAPLILVGGAFHDRHARAAGTPLASELAGHFTVHSYDRRGRGDSSDTPPYSIAREVEDLAAVIAAAGGTAFVFGLSSGGLLAFDAAAQGLSISRLALYEPPVILDPARATALEALATRLDDSVKAGRRGEAVELFLSEGMGMPKPQLEQLRSSPMWPGDGLAHTLSDDARISARGAVRLEEAKTVRAATLVLDGAASAPWMRESVKMLARAIPGGRHQSLEGQTHSVDPKALAAALVPFFGG